MAEAETETDPDLGGTATVETKVDGSTAFQSKFILTGRSIVIDEFSRAASCCGLECVLVSAMPATANAVFAFRHGARADEQILAKGVPAGQVSTYRAHYYRLQFVRLCLTPGVAVLDSICVYLRCRLAALSPCRVCSLFSAVSRLSFPKFCCFNSIARFRSLPIDCLPLSGHSYHFFMTGHRQMVQRPGEAHFSHRAD